MQGWEMSEEKQYISYVLQRISMVAYLCSFVIFTLSMVLFHGCNRESFDVSMVLLVIGAAFATMDAVVLCDVPICYTENVECLDEEEKAKIQELIAEIEELEQEEKDKD